MILLFLEYWSYTSIKDSFEYLIMTFVFGWINDPKMVEIDEPVVVDIAGL